MATTTCLDRFLEPMTAARSPKVARRIVELRASPETEARPDELAGKANEGTLTAEEAEYQESIDAVDIISIIQAKARRFLAQHGTNSS